MAEGVTEDPGSTVDVATEEEGMMAVSTPTAAMEPVGTTTGTLTTPEVKMTVQMIENPEAGGKLS